MKFKEIKLAIKKKCLQANRIDIKPHFFKDFLSGLGSFFYSLFYGKLALFLSHH